MGACRPFTMPELHRLLTMEAERWEDTRDCALVALGVQTGYRIRELLSLDRKDFLSGGAMRLVIRVAAKNAKTGVSRWTTLEEATGRLVGRWLDDERRLLGMVRGDEPAFPSRVRGRRMTRQAAYQAIRRRCERCGVATEWVGTHSLRKTFALISCGMARELHGREEGSMLLELEYVRQALGHVHIKSTQSYLASVKPEQRSLAFAAADRAIEMALSRNG